MILELPCDLGDRVYYIHPMRLKDKTYSYPIIYSEVVAVHFGRRLNGATEKYIKLCDTVTGYMSGRISFDNFNKCCFYTYEEALEAVEILKLQ
jgi:hypothetical protein